MGGLLYKDFVFIKGKKIIWILTALTVLMVVLRLVFKGTEVLPDFMATDDEGNQINFVDAYFFIFDATLIYLGFMFINMWTDKIALIDEKNKIRSYIAAMPVGKNAFVASKYIFIAIATFIFFSLSQIWLIIGFSYMGDGPFKEMMYYLSELTLLTYLFALLMVSVELPLFILLGKGNSLFVRVAIPLIIAVAAIAFLLFGDYELINNFNIGLIFDWMKNHQTELTFVSILSPIVIGVEYYLSYLLTSWIYAKKEVSINE